MNLKNWMKKTDSAQRQRLADCADTSVGYLWQLAGGHRKPGVETAKALVKASQRVTPTAPMTLDALRPDIWGERVA